MAQERQLRRSRKAILGGVCAGVADYFRIDPIVVRIIAVAATLLTAGLLAVAYVALLVVVPKESSVGETVDVRAQSAVSDRFGPLDCGPSAHRPGAAPGPGAPRGPGRPSGPIGTGHLPPEPPAGFRRQ